MHDSMFILFSMSFMIPYQELNDSTYATDTDDGEMEVANIILHHLVVVHFTGEKHKLCYICLLQLCMEDQYCTFFQER
jgi:hypothetical protein